MAPPGTRERFRLFARSQQLPDESAALRELLSLGWAVIDRRAEQRKARAFERAVKANLKAEKRQQEKGEC